MKSISGLDVYRLAEELADLVWTAYDGWSWKAQQTMGLQIIRSADSIAANIAEGYGRYTPSDRRKFYLYARGSLEETKAWLRKAVRRRVIAKNEVANYQVLVNQLGPKLNAFIRVTNRSACE
jgi:four helix bundle protein